jgi:hypothetical protein
VLTLLEFFIVRAVLLRGEMPETYVQQKQSCPCQFVFAVGSPDFPKSKRHTFFGFSQALIKLSYTLELVVIDNAAQNCSDGWDSSGIGTTSGATSGRYYVNSRISYNSRIKLLP